VLDRHKSARPRGGGPVLWRALRLGPRGSGAGGCAGPLLHRQAGRRGRRRHRLAGRRPGRVEHLRRGAERRRGRREGASRGRCRADGARRRARRRPDGSARRPLERGAERLGGTAAQGRGARQRAGNVELEQPPDRRHRIRQDLLRRGLRLGVSGRELRRRRVGHGAATGLRRDAGGARSRDPPAPCRGGCARGVLGRGRLDAAGRRRIAALDRDVRRRRHRRGRGARNAARRLRRVGPGRPGSRSPRGPARPAGAEFTVSRYDPS
jgi:hypothetical protein